MRDYILFYHPAKASPGWPTRGLTRAQAGPPWLMTRHGCKASVAEQPPPCVTARCLDADSRLTGRAVWLGQDLQTFVV